MHRIAVDTKGGSYEVLIGRGVRNELGNVTRACAGGDKAFIVTDSNVGPLYEAAAAEKLRAAGYDVPSRTFPAGERTKCLASFAAGLDAAAQAGMTRGDVFVALGGGVMGDLGGFIAASYMRGVDVVQVPTSLLAMVDSSVGGKTGVDIPGGKNLCGAFWQPKAVVCDIDCLATLDEALFRDSCGEVIKYGVMCDPELFASLEASPLTLADASTDRLEDIVAACVSIKRDVVEKDEREGGLRQILNLGHTIGHAVEAASDYARGHGECVAIGMCYMARACAALGICDDATAGRVVSCVAAHGLATASEFDADTLFDFVLHDKKRHGDTVNAVVIEGVGRVSVRTFPLGQFKELIALGA
jgi:3-dehydroquinate synthase